VSAEVTDRRPAVRHRIARLAELPDGHGWHVELDGQQIAVFRRGGEVHAIEGVCPHRGAALAFGDVRGEVVYCPLHAWPFHLPTGGCPEFPGVAVRTFPVHVEGGEVFVEL
jgi:nitrite reductase (NADH) small subunit